MVASSPSSGARMFSHLYVEESVMDHPEARRIIEKFDRSRVIAIRHYKELFNRPAQSFAAQSKNKNLILARREGKFLHEGSRYSDGFGYEQFYYASTLMGCLYDCDYCYLQGLYPSANTVMFVNLEDAFAELSPLLDRPTLVATSYDTDTMAVESLTHQSRRWLEFARTQENLHLEIRTKSANFKSLSTLPPHPQTTLAWSLSPQEIIERYERGTPSLEKRLKAVSQALEAGWQVRLCIDPVIHNEAFESLYAQMFETIRQTIDLDKVHQITLGSFRMSTSHLKALKKLRRSDVAFYPYDVHDETATYPKEIESHILAFLLDTITPHFPSERIRTWQRQS